ncbi:unnamed protein product [Lymnaea stagnalis]|uniref:Calnexin n=1 Tax=Lymnaea stagnalis TaxID=6523 RepID=A0AAV2IGR5_LYMST
MKIWSSIILMAALLLMTSLAADFEEEDDAEDGIVEVEDEVVFEKERPVYERPVPSGATYFLEPFDTRAEFLKRWVQSQAKKDGAEDHLAKYDGKWAVEEARENPIIRDLGLILKTKAKHHAIAAKLDKPFDFNGKPLIVQYEVKFQNGIDCGGAYIKLLSKGEQPLNLKAFTDKTPYTIMFGPDKCGNDHKLHFIFRHKNPKTGQYEEKHAEKPTAKLENFFTDRKTHLYTLIVNPDNTYEVKVDNGLVASGDLLNNFSPPVNPPKEIEDPFDKKPADWDDRERLKKYIYHCYYWCMINLKHSFSRNSIPDADAKKPDDWDESEPATIIDEDAVRPDGWLEDEEVYTPDPTAIKPGDWYVYLYIHLLLTSPADNPKCKDAPGCGQWERPTIPNPKYKGTWRPPMIENPDYKGEWKPKTIANPDYFEDNHPYKMTPIEAIGLELWSMTDDILFDNFLVADNESVVEEFTALTWELKSIQERAAASTGSWWQAIKSSTDERPWLWAVYVVVLLLPIVFLSIWLCPKSGPVKQCKDFSEEQTIKMHLPKDQMESDDLPEDIDAHRKKFDDPSPDVIDEGDEDVANEEEESEDKKGAGDATSAEIGEETTEAGAAGDGNPPTTDEVIEGDEGDVQGSPKKSNSPRKRKTRKE